MFPQFQRYYTIGSALAGWMDNMYSTSTKSTNTDQEYKDIANARGVTAGTKAFVAAKGLDPIFQQNAYNVAYDKAYNDYMIAVALPYRSSKAGSADQIMADMAAAEKIAAEKLASDATYQEFLTGQKSVGQPTSIVPGSSPTMDFIKKYGLYLALGGGLLALLIINKKIAARKAGK